MIRNIIFDMGRVLIHWGPELLFSVLSLSEADKKLLEQEVFRGTEWIRLDRGVISEEEATVGICKRLPESLHEAVRALVYDWWKHPMVPMEGMEELIRELKEEGYGIYCLSNASFRLQEYFPRIPGSQYFDGLMVSAQEHLLKPDPAIFYRLLERYSLQAAECVFIDDTPVNAEGAEYVGIAGCVFHGEVMRLRKDLCNLGVSCKTE